MTATGLALALVAVLALAAAALAVPALASSRGPTVRVGDFFYSRAQVTVARGTRVTWAWVAHSGIPHTVTVRRGPVRFSSKVLTAGTFSHLFTRRGVYHLFCRIHPTQMRMTVIVR
jgi:plastocyanin